MPKLSQSSYAIGLKAELDACTFLKRDGFAILHQRWKSAFGEIDVIASKDTELVFFEIKGGRQCSLTAKQKRRCANAALDFISSDCNHSSFRFDCIFISNGEVEHIQNAFYIEESSS